MPTWKPNFKKENILCTGWLCKQPVGRTGLDHSNALTSGWKTRFFCLGNDALSYYTYRPKEHRLKLKGAIPLDGMCQVIRENTTTFRIVKAGATNLTLAMKTPDDAMSMSKIPYGLPIVMHPREGDYTPTKACSMWVQKIFNVISNLKKRSSQSSQDTDETIEKMRLEGLLSEEEYKNYLNSSEASFIASPRDDRNSMSDLLHHQTTTAVRGAAPNTASGSKTRKTYKVVHRELKNLDCLAFPDMQELDMQLFFKPLKSVKGKNLSSKNRHQINDLVKQFNNLVTNGSANLSLAETIKRALTATKDPDKEAVVRKRFSKLSIVIAYLTAVLSEVIKEYKGNKIKFSLDQLATAGWCINPKKATSSDKMLHNLGISKLVHDIIFYDKVVAVLVRVEVYAGLSIHNFQLKSRQSSLWKIVERIAVFKGVAKILVMKRDAMKKQKQKQKQHKRGLSLSFIPKKHQSASTFDFTAVNVIMDRIKDVANNTIYYLERVRTLEQTIIPKDPDVFIRRVENSQFNKHYKPHPTSANPKVFSDEFESVGNSASPESSEAAAAATATGPPSPPPRDLPRPPTHPSSDRPSPLPTDPPRPLSRSRRRASSPALPRSFMLPKAPRLTKSFSEIEPTENSPSKPERRQLQGGYWLEACSGPLHFPMNRLVRYYRHWKSNHKNMMSFARYMAVFPLRMLRATEIAKLAQRDLVTYQKLVDAGLGNGLRDEGVRYLDQAERAQYHVTINDDGLLVDAKGKLFSTVDMCTGHSGKGWAMVVYREDSGMFCAPHVNDRFHHSTIFGGEAVDFAGELQVEDGRMLQANNKSGHYKPGQRETAKFLLFLKSSGVQLQGIKFDVLQGNPGLASTPRPSRRVLTCSASELLVDENDYGDDSGEEVHIGAVQVRDLEEEEVSDSSEEELEEEEVHEYDPSTS